MKKIGLLALIAVLVLGLLGVGYAWTTQNMTVQGQAVTGTTLAEFYIGGSAYGPYYNQRDMVYGTTWGSYGAQSFYVTIYNAYSSASVSNIPVTILNAGTVPLVVTGLTVTDWHGYPASTVSFTPPAGNINVGATGIGYITVTLPSNFDAYVAGGGDTAPIFTAALSYTAP